MKYVAAAERTGRDGVTARAVLLAFALLVGIAVAGFYIQIVWGSVTRLSAGVPARAQLGLLFLLTALMSMPVLRRFALARRELLTVYCIVLVGGPLVSSGILFWMLPHQIAYHYQAEINPLWRRTFLPHVPAWFAPSEASVVRGFFEGGASVPWSAWAVPLLAWGGFMLALFFCTFCLMSLLQHQWIANERLTFPTALIPLHMVREPVSRDMGDVGRLPLSRLFWLGLGIALLISFTNRLADRVPAVPAIPTGPMPLMRWHKVGPLAGLGEIQLLLWPWLIALAYLIPRDLSFSIWFFWFVRLGLSVAAIAAGAEPVRPEEWYSSAFPAPYFQGGGAMLALTLWTLWIARRHLAAAARSAFGRASLDSDLAAPIPHRWAVPGVVLSVAVLVGFCLFAGCGLLVSLALVTGIVGYYFLWARLRAEAGLGYLFFPIEIESALVQSLGRNAFRTREIITLVSARWATFAGGGDTFEVCTGSVLESFKVADSAAIGKRRLAAAMAAGFLLSLTIGIYVLMRGFYHYGYFGTYVGEGSAWAWSWQTRNDGERILQRLSSTENASFDAVLAIAVGALVTVALGMLRLRFLWWPLHPLGYIAANTWGMFYYYMPFMIGWALNSLVIRYGGLRLYRQTVPLAVGLVVGDMLNPTLWALASLVTLGRV